jgi:hypothetical protein
MENILDLAPPTTAEELGEGPNMKKDDARLAVLGEYDGWAKDHPNDAKMMGGFVFFSYRELSYRPTNGGSEAVSQST